MTMQLSCAHHTTCSRKCVMALVESGKDFEYVHIDMAAGGHKSAAFLAKHPFGKVPVLQDGDFTLFESRAIMRYVLSGTPLDPSTKKEQALLDQATSVEYSYFGPAFMPIYFERMLKPAKKLGATDETKVAAAIAELGPVLDVVERLLEGKAYFAGDTFTMADITYMPYFAVFGKLGIEDMLSSRPNLARWWANVSQRPAWQYTFSGNVVEKAAK
ncbi:glutathione S-transferase [Pelagophyceae sp. CCMP2097]|nr:glutathione S-transferase [Pelagophyceae sp. CCMP2097]